MINCVIFKRIAWGLIMLLLMIPLSTASAQEGDVITPGQPVIGTIDNTNYFQVWRYASAGNETITVSVEATSGDLDPNLVIITAELQAFGINDDVDAQNYNSIVSDLYLPNPDTAFIIVSRFGGHQGTSSGGYRLILNSSAGGTGGTGGTGGVGGMGDTGGAATFTLDEATVKAGAEEAWNHLMALGVIPNWQGEMGITIPSGAFVEGSDSNRILSSRVGRGYEAADMVIHADVQWRGDDDTMACGLLFRSQSDGDAYGVYLGREGWVDLGGFFPNYESIGSWNVSDLNTRDDGTNNLLVTVVDDEITVFVNYELVAAATDTRISGAGEFYVSVFKAPGVPVRCNFNNYWAISIYP